MLSLATRQIKAWRVPSLRQGSWQWGHVAALSVQAVEGSGEEATAKNSSPPSPGSALPLHPGCSTVSITSCQLKMDHAPCRGGFQLWISSQGNLHQESVKHN